MEWYLKVMKENYSNFSGRARRKEYWMFMLFHTIIGIALSMFNPIIYWIYSLVILIPVFAVSVRRMHDVGKSGWYLWIPIYNFVLCCTNGDSGDNEYGPNPKTEKEAVELI